MKSSKWKYWISISSWATRKDLFRETLNFKPRIFHIKVIAPPVRASRYFFNKSFSTHQTLFGHLKVHIQAYSALNIHVKTTKARAIVDPMSAFPRHFRFRNLHEVTAIHKSSNKCVFPRRSKGKRMRFQGRDLELGTDPATMNGNVQPSFTSSPSLWITVVLCQSLWRAL